MNNSDIQNALSGIDDKYLDKSFDFQELSSQFKREKNKKIRSVCAVCCCMVICLVAFGFTQSNLFNSKVPIVPEKNPTDNSLNISLSPTSETNAQTTTEQSIDNTLSTNAPTEPKKDTEVTVPTTVSDKGNSEEIFLDSKYVTYITTGAYSTYQEGKVIDESKVGEKIGDITVTAGWTNGDSDIIIKPETLRAEIYAIKNISPDIAICIKFIDKGEALTTEHYYLRSNPNADRSEVKDYLIPEDVLPIGTDGSIPE